ncbi:MAG: hypothetical protein HND46_23590 [Chloroflexi bacterium]|nr:hypothetical protein [Chloroflexota bacterium]NOG66405.1 hypothetical protein [Chloroflexota bacterium]
MNTVPNQTHPTDILPLQTGGCGVTEDGNSYCNVDGEKCACGTTPHATMTTHTTSIVAPQSAQWTKIRSGALFVVACLTSPCCTPLYVPLLLVLLAGTPFAVRLGAHVGWVYGGLALVSVASGFMAWRSWQGKRG